MRNYIIIIFIGAVLFIPFLGAVHLFDWDEINFAESAREMLVTHDFSRVQINFQPFWEKPPLFIWMQALSMSIFGINEFAARFPNAIAGIVTLCVIFYAGSKWKDTRMGWLWVCMYIGSFLPQLYFKSGIIDPWFNLFIFLGIFQLSRLSNRNNYRDLKRMQIALQAGVFIGLAILTKGPVAMLITILSLIVVWIRGRMVNIIKVKEIILFLVIAGIVSSAWFALETIKHGPWFIMTFIKYQLRLMSTEDSGHGGPIYYHLVVLLLGCFPASIFALGAFKQDLSETYVSRNGKFWMSTLLFIVLIVFSLVKTKIIHYSSLAWFPLTYLGAFYLNKLLYTTQKSFKWYHLTGLFVIGSIYAIALAAVPFIDNFKGQIEPLIGDKFGKLALYASVMWNPITASVGVIFFILLIASIFLLRNMRSQLLGLGLLLMGTIISIQCLAYFYIPNIEGYSQRAAIDFFISKQNENCAVEVLGYKSYAQYFYTMKQQPKDTNELNTYYLLTHKINKPVYFVSKIDRYEQPMKDYHLIKTGEANGFVFLKKEN